MQLKRLRIIVLGLGCLVLTSLFLFLTWTTHSVQREVRTEIHRLETEFASITSCINPRRKPATDSKESCSLGYVLQRGVCVQCLPGKFSLPNWIACQMLLSCETIQHEVTVKGLIHSLIHWKYYRADWKGYEIMYAEYYGFFRTSINYSAIQSFSPSQNILYPIGFCEEENIVLFASNRTFIESGNHFEKAFNRNPVCNHCMVKLNLVISYLHVLVKLHSVNTVLCNSYSYKYLLSQFFITDGFSLVLATLDNLLQDANTPILCKLSEIRGNFSAPEQRWPYGETKIFNLAEQPKYNRTTDIWKVPDVASVFLKTCVEVMDYLELIHQQCKTFDPGLRPTAAQVLEQYQHVWGLMFSDEFFL